MTAYVEIRTQHAKGTWPRKGPDTYIAVQVVPEGQKRLRALMSNLAKKRGIEIIYCGEGYSTRTGPRSMFGQAYQKAVELAEKINKGLER